MKAFIMKVFVRSFSIAFLLFLPVQALSAQPVIDNVLPSSGTVLATASVTLSGQAIGAVSVTIEGQAATLVGDAWSLGPLALAVEGANAFSIVASDGQGADTTLILTLVRDTTAPQVSVSSPAAGGLTGQSVVDLTGSSSDVHLVSVTVGGTVASLSGGSFVALGVPLGEGSNALVVRAEDVAGNATEIVHTVVRDQVAPILAITDPVAGTILPDASMVVSGTVDDAHLDRVEVGGVSAAVTVGSGTTHTWSYTVSLSEGINTLAVTAIDTLGNRADASVTVTRDSQAPEITILQPGEGLATQADQVVVSGTVSDEAGVMVTVNGVAATISGGAFSLATLPLVAGENRLIARATDAQGNQGTHSRTVVRDNQAPTFVSSSPVSGALAVAANTIFRIDFDAPLATPVAGAWRLETAAGTAVAASLEHAGAQLRIVPSDVLPGSTDLRVVLTTALADPAGNALASEIVLDYHTADTSVPDPPTLQPVPSPLCASTVILVGVAEAGSLVEVQGGAGGATVRANEADGSFALVVELLSEAPNVLQLTATDAEGNRSLPTEFVVVQDCVAPVVSSAAVTGAAVPGAGDVIEVRFSEPMDAVSVSAAVTASAGGSAITGTTILDAGATIATFTPDLPLPAGGVDLGVSTLARDPAGNALAFAFAARVGASGDSFLSGTVIDDATGRPLAGARVVITATDGVALVAPLPTQTTDTDGRFLLAVAAGSHDLTIAKDGYTPVFRVVATLAGEGSDVFDPRLTPVAVTASLDAGGGVLEAENGAVVLDVATGALAQTTAVSLSPVGEQGLPSRLPFGWSPRGAVWLDLEDQLLAVPATLSWSVEAADGVTLAIVALDLATLQWRVADLVMVIDGAVIAQPDATGAWVAVEADVSSQPPPPAVIGEALGAAPVPAGASVLAATLAFDPATVLATQTSAATVTYVVAGEVPSGLPLTLAIEEQLELLDGTTRQAPPYAADLLLYHDPSSQPRSRFQLQPSESARMLPLAMGSESVSVEPYLGGAVQGNVIGTDGGSVVNAEGDRVDLAPGALVAPTAVVLTRRALTDLPLGTPRGTVIDGVVDLDLGGASLQSSASLSLALASAPLATEDGILLQVIDLDGSSAIRPVARLVATAAGWSTQAIDPLDLPWPGITEGGLFAFARFTIDHGFLRGIARDLAGDPLPGAVLSSAAVDWRQVSDSAGRYVLPLPVGTATVDVSDPLTGNQVTVTVSVDAADARIDLDPTVALVPPTVVEILPADGAVGVLGGIEPTVRFSEPIDPATAAVGVRLLDGTVDVGAAVLVTGDLARLVPQASLVPGRDYRIDVSRAVRDLAGNALDVAVSAQFTVAVSTLPTGVTPERIFLVEPATVDAEGVGPATVQGLAGAVPSGTLVFAENTSRFTSTESVNAAADGSFTLSLEAAVGDRLLLHILIIGANEVLLPLDVFMAADLRTAFVGSEAVSFTTVDGVGVALEAGTFTGPTAVTAVAVDANNLPLATPSAAQGLFGFTLDFGGAQPQRPLIVRLPLADLAVQPAAGDSLVLASSVEALGRRWWLLDDLMRVAGDSVTNAPTLGGPTANVIVVEGEALSANGEGAVAPQSVAVKMATGGPTPGGVTHAGTFHVMAFSNFALVAIPTLGPTIGVFSPAFSFAGIMLTSVAPHLALSHFLLPTSLGQPATIEGWNLSTGEQLFHQVLPATTDPVVILPVSIFGEDRGPYPIGGSPLGFFSFEATASEYLQLAPGISVAQETAGASLRLDVALGTLRPGTEVRLHGAPPLDVAVSAIAAPDGSVSLSVPRTPGVRYVLAIGAQVTTDQALEIRFNEAVSIPAGIVLKRGSNVVPVVVTQPTSTNAVHIRPRDGWRTGSPYRLELTESLVDFSGNPILQPAGGCGGAACGHPVSIAVTVRASQVLSTLALKPVRDVARLGSLLFVAAGGTGLVVVDASDPDNLRDHLLPFPLPLNDPVTGVEVDAHGRVIYVGGGVSNFGVLRILDVQKMDRVALGFGGPSSDPDPTWRDQVVAGLSIVSNRFDQTNHPGLVPGKPVDVTLVGEDETTTWVVGDAAPAGLTIVAPTPPPVGDEPFILTVTGSDGTAGLPVTLRDLTRGSFRREDAAEDQTYSVSLKVRPGDQVSLLRNRKSFAYVALASAENDASLVVIDVSKVYRRALGAPGDVGPVSGVLANIYPSDIQITQQQATTAFCTANAVREVVDYRQVHVMRRESADVGQPAELTFLGLARSYGLTALDVPPSDLTDVRVFLGGQCGEQDGVRRMSGMAVAEQYTVLVTDPTTGVEREKVGDYVVLANEIGVLLVAEIGQRVDRETDIVRLVSRIRLPGAIGRLTLDRAHHRLLVAGRGAGVYVVDFSRLSLTPIDADNDGQDDRLLETIDLGDNISAAPILVPELGLAFAGGLTQGLSGIALDSPRLRLVNETPAGGLREVDRLAPFGVPTVAGTGAATATATTAPDASKPPGLVRIHARLPGVAATIAADGSGSIRVRVAGVGPEGATVRTAGTAGGTAGVALLIPPVIYTEDAFALGRADAMVLERQADQPWQEGYNVFLSQPLVLLADLRASIHVAMTAAEKADPALCARCDLVDEGVYASAAAALAAPYAELLSGHQVAVSLTPTVRTSLAEIYTAELLDQAAIAVASVPWDISPARKQEPTRNPAMGSGDVAPGTLLHSGEMTLGAVDLSIRGRGFDFAFVRTHRSQTLGNGPFGPGWDHGYRQRLRALPNGDVEYFDGRGRRETFTANGDGSFEAPVGRFWTLEHFAEGFVLTDAGRMQRRFDAFGRLSEIRDAIKISADTGNAMRFAYDGKGRLAVITDTLDRDITLHYDFDGRIEAVEDFTGRIFTYHYDTEGRLIRFETPAVETANGGDTPVTAPLVTAYAYQTLTGSNVTSLLRQRDNIVTRTDPKGQDWLTLAYTDADGDTYADEVTTQTWGGDALSIDYTAYGSAAKVIDRRGTEFLYTLNDAGQMLTYKEPLPVADGGGMATWTNAYNADGLLSAQTQPLGRVTTLLYDNQAGRPRRGQGNVLDVTVTADSRGANGSDSVLTTQYRYDTDTNQAIEITDARSAVTDITRQPKSGLATQIERPELVVTEVEYNDFGQVTQVTNPNNNLTTFAYFTSGTREGYLREQVVAVGGPALTTTYDTDARGNVISTRDPRRIQHTRQYNVLDWPVSTVAAQTGGDGASPLSYTTNIAYDANGNRASLALPFDQGTTHTEVRYRYDVLDVLLEEQRQIEGATFAITQYQRDANRNITTTTDPENNQVTLTYEGRNLPQERTSNLGPDQVGVAIVETFRYNAEGERVAVTDGRSKVWTTQYDGFGRLHQSSDPLGNTRHRAYDNASNVTCSMATTLPTTAGDPAPLLAAVTQRHDLLGRPIYTRQHLWQYDQLSPIAACPTAPIAQGDFVAFPGTTQLVSQQIWDPASNLMEQVDAKNRHTLFAYDSAERMNQRIDPLGNIQDYVLDANGNTVQFTSTEAVEGSGFAVVTTEATFDALNRPIEQRDGLNNRTKTTYDARNLVRLVVDAENFTQTFGYDGLNRKTFETKEPGIRIDYGWDKASRLRTYTDALGNVSAWTHDAVNRKRTQTLPGNDLWQYTYDPSHNVSAMIDPNGTTVTNTHDDANRLTSRGVVRGTGVIGPTAEAYAYDGLDRMLQAKSGNGTPAAITNPVTTDHVFDSASRLLRETTLGKTVAYGFDPVHNRIQTTYPSGYQIDVIVDLLNRPAVIDQTVPGGTATPAVSYGYRGPVLLHSQTLGNGLATTIEYDNTWRPTKASVSRPAALQATFEETLAWSPRSLKTAIGRGDAGGRGFVLEHDGARRMLRAATVPAASEIANNTVPAVPGTSSLAFEYGHDLADNLSQRGIEIAGDEDPFALTNDASGRNRPGLAGSDTLGYDANGNRTVDGTNQLAFDYRNRLIEVRDASGTLIATYTYDAFNRRVRKDVVGQPVEEMVYASWQEIERYTGGQLDQCYTHGAGLDEIVRMEVDLDENGTLETVWTPIYDHTGNLVKLTGTLGEVVARYDYSPFGEMVVAHSDLIPPVVELIAVDPANRAILVNFDAETFLNESVVSIEDTSSPGQSLALPFSINRPVQEGPVAGRRFEIVLDTAPLDDTPLRLTLTTAAAVDRFGNPLQTAVVVDFTWPATTSANDGIPQVLQDTAAPQVERVRLDHGFVEITFSEPPAPGAAGAITVTEAVSGQSQATTWTLQADGHTLRSDTVLVEGSFVLDIDNTTPVDFAGTPLANSFQQGFEIGLPLGIEIAYDRPDPTEVPLAAFVNRFGFHGRPVDEESGYAYFRNRYFDPGTGRFVTADPLGYTDSPSMYQGFGSSPLNFGDPFGLTLTMGEEELAVFQGIVSDLGEASLAAGLALNDQEQVMIPNGEMLEWARSAANNPTLKLLFKAVIDRQLEVDLRFVNDPSLASHGGAKTSPHPFKMVRGNRYYRFDTRIDREVNSHTKFKLGQDSWEVVPDRVTMVHEIAHAVGTREKGLASTVRLFGQEGPTDQYAVDREDEYREAIGLTPRLSHSVPAIHCPGGDWGSDLCQRKKFCRARGNFKTDSDYCIQLWDSEKKKGLPQ